MSLATSNRDGGKTSESGHLRAIMKAISGEVLTGLNVSQRAAGANMSVDIAIGDAVIPRSDGTYGHPAWNDAVYNQAITTADGSNPRRDIVVMYIDYNQAPSTAVSNNTNGVVKIAVVAGTPAGSPADPSGATIQSAVGSGNPYIKLARVRVGAGVTTISNSVIDDLRVMASGLVQNGWSGVPASEAVSFAFSSWNATTQVGVITVPTDATTRYGLDALFKFAQATGGIKYGKIIAITSTSISLWMPGYTLNNEAINSPQFSFLASPVGVPAALRGNANPYRFMAYRTAGLALTDSVLATVPMTTEEYDDNSNYDSTTGIWTCPVDGLYDIKALCTVQGAGSGNNMMWETFINLLHNNTTVLSKADLNQYDTGMQSIYAGAITLERKFTAGDTLRIQGLGDTNNGQPPAVVGGRERNYFSARLVART